MSSTQKYLIVIAGATASGKTRTAISLAQHFDTEILSCDSRQFYKEMSIGTAKPTLQELALAKHHFIDSLSIFEEYSAGAYERDALMLLGEIFTKKNCAILTGGSGLFMRAVLEGLDDFPAVSKEIRQKWESILQAQGIDALQDALKIKDFDYYQEVDINNPHRLIRALSVCDAGGKPYSSFKQKKNKKRPFVPIMIFLDWERTLLYNRIDQRVLEMVKEGLFEEAKSLQEFRHLQALQTVGYQEVFKYFDGLWSAEMAISEIQKNTRRYAKRQYTWFRKEADIAAFHPSKIEAIKDYVLAQMC